MGKIVLTYLYCFWGLLGAEMEKVPTPTIQPVVIETTCTIVSEAGDDVVLCNGLPGQLNGSATGNFTNVEWSPGAGLSSTTILNPVVNVSDETVYTLTVFGIGDNIVENGDFESGNISPASSTFTYVDPGDFPNGPGTYTVGNSGNIIFLPGLCDAHTGFNMMVTRGSGNDAWCQSLEVEPFTDYKLEVWVGGVEIIFLANSASVDVKINGNVLGTVGGSAFCDWNIFQTTWNSGPNTTADLCLDVSGDRDSYALIDDISMIECCAIKDDVTVRVEEVNAEILPAGPINCLNHPIVLDGGLSTQGSGFTYEWTTQDGLITAGDNTLNPEIDKQGTYKLLITGPLGCTHETEILIEGSVEPPDVFFYGGKMDCQNDSATIWVDTNFIKNLKFEWFGPDSFRSNQRVDTVTTAGKYFVIVSDPYFCESKDTVEVVDFRTQAEFNVAIDSLNCGNDTARITLNFPDSLATILWEGPNGFMAVGIEIIAPDTGIYYLHILDSLGCPYEDTIAIEDYRKIPNIYIQADTITCARPFANLIGASDSSNVVFRWTGPNGFDRNSSNTTTTDTGWYYLEVNIPGECSITDSIRVVADGEIPMLNILGDTLNCFQDEITLTGVTNDPNATISWSGPNNISSDQLIISVRDSGTYYLTVENAKGCKITKSFYVVSDMNPPDVQITGNNEINCKNAFVVLADNDTLSGLTPNWRFEGQDISSASKISVNQGGWYYLSKTGKNGCLGIDSIQVEVDTMAPDYVLYADTINCSNANPRVRITSWTAHGTWFWYNPNTKDYDIPANSLDVVQPGWYRILVSRSNFCSVFDSIEVKIDTVTPIVRVQDDSLTCAINSVQLSANVLNAYQSLIWSGPNGFTSNILNPTISEPGVYSVTVTAQNGCSSTAEIRIKRVGQLPDIDALGDTLNCTTPTVVVTGNSITPGVSYSWVGPNGFSADIASPSVSDSGWYELTVTGVDGCQSKRQVYVGLDDERPVESWEGDTLTCDRPMVTIQSLGGRGTYNYQWVGPNGFVSDSQNNTISVPGIYIVTMTGKNGCRNSISVTIEADLEVPTVVLLDDTLDCKTLSAQLYFTTLTRDYSIIWNGPNGFQSGDENPLVNTTGIYSLTLKNNQNGCENTEDLNVFPPDEILSIQTSTEGDCSNNFSLTINQVQGGKGPFQYAINGGSFQSDNQFDVQPGSVDITVEDINGCSFTESIRVDSIPSINGSLTGDIELVAGEKYNVQTQVNRTDNEIVEVTWTPGEGLSCTNCLNPVITATIDRTYQVTIKDIFGCEISLEIRVSVKTPDDVYIPNTFTPNGDGINDQFFIQTNINSSAEVIDFAIYSRWGEMVFSLATGQTNNGNDGWDGRFNAQDVLPGVYVYRALIRWPNGQEKAVEGSITLIR